MSAYVHGSETAHIIIFSFYKKVHQHRGCVGVCLSGQIYSDL